MKIVGVFRDERACEQARRMVREAGVEDSRVRVDSPCAEVPGGCELSVMCDSAEDREWIDELLRRAGSTGTWAT